MAFYSGRVYGYVLPVNQFEHFFCLGRPAAPQATKESVF